MALNGIDISNWQAGIDLSAVPCDFVISKATEGCWYVSADCARQVEQALSLGKCVGVYHYANGGNAVSEADFFALPSIFRIPLIPAGIVKLPSL